MTAGSRLGHQQVPNAIYRSTDMMLRWGWSMNGGCQSQPQQKHSRLNAKTTKVAHADLAFVQSASSKPPQDLG